MWTMTMLDTGNIFCNVAKYYEDLGQVPESSDENYTLLTRKDSGAFDT